MKEFVYRIINILYTNRWREQSINRQTADRPIPKAFVLLGYEYDMIAQRRMHTSNTSKEQVCMKKQEWKREITISKFKFSLSDLKQTSGKRLLKTVWRKRKNSKNIFFPFSHNVLNPVKQM